MESHLLYYQKSLIRYYVHGKGEPLVLVHGYQSDSQIWKYMVPELEDRFMLIIPDLPGHGGTSLIQPANTMEHLAEVIYRICISLQLEKIHLAGHSMGGYIALSFLEKFPIKTKKVFLINSHPAEDSLEKLLVREHEACIIQKGKKEFLLRNFIPKNFAGKSIVRYPDRVNETINNALHQDQKGMLADIVGMMLRSEKLSLIAKIKQKIIFILGDEDLRISQNIFNKKEIKGHEVILLEKCGHFGLIEHPEKVSAIIKKYSDQTCAEEIS